MKKNTQKFFRLAGCADNYAHTAFLKEKKYDFSACAMQHISITTVVHFI